MKCFLKSNINIKTNMLVYVVTDIFDEACSL